MKLGTKFTPIKLSVTSIAKKIQKNNISINYALQREPNRWTLIDKGNEISDILQSNPIPDCIFVERISENGVPRLELIDGLQRIMNAINYINGDFKISQKVDRYNIEYVDGGEIYTFDIRGKKFDQLPSELQDMIRDYEFHITEFLNCSDEDVEYHMTRYNRGVRLNNSEKTVCSLGEKFAIKMRDILDNSFFCLDHDNYSKSERNTSALAKVVIECVMIINHFDKWTKNPINNGKYLNEHATEKEFEDFYRMSEELDDVITEEVRELFNAKNSFLFFKLLAKFHEANLTDEQFVEFMEVFKDKLHEQNFGDEQISWDTLMENRGNKDASVIRKRMDWLYSATENYFGIVIPEDVIKKENNDDVNNTENETENETEKKPNNVSSNVINNETNNANETNNGGCEATTESTEDNLNDLNNTNTYDVNGDVENDNVQEVQCSQDTLNHNSVQNYSADIFDSLYYNLVSESEVIKTIDFSNDDIREIANEAMALYKNMSFDEMIGEGKDEISSADYFEIKENLDVIDVISLDVDSNSDFFQIENIAALINIAVDAFKLDVKNEQIEKWFCNYVNAFTDEKLKGSYEERFETLKHDFERFVSFHSGVTVESLNDVLMQAS